MGRLFTAPAFTGHRIPASASGAIDACVPSDPRSREPPHRGGDQRGRTRAGQSTGGWRPEGGKPRSGGMFSLAARRDWLHLVKCDEAGSAGWITARDKEDGAGMGHLHYSCLRNGTFRTSFFFPLFQVQTKPP